MKNRINRPDDTTEKFISAYKRGAQNFIAAAKLLGELKAKGVSDSDLFTAKGFEFLKGLPPGILAEMHAFNDGKITEAQLLEKFVMAMASKHSN
jgi:hypothetical protein